MISHHLPSSAQTNRLNSIIQYQSLTYAKPSSPLTMNSILGSKAKMAITNSLGKLNSKFRMNAFSGPGAYSGVIQNQTVWSASEQRVWVVVLVMGVALLYGNRMTLPFSLNDIAEVGDWSTNLKSAVLGSFYWGYLCAPLLGHYLSDRFGGELVQWISAVVWSAGLGATALFIPNSYVAVMMLRFLCGLAQGFHVPALLSIISRRSPENSRTFLFSIIMAGAHVGSVLSSALSSFVHIHDSSKWRYPIVLVSFLGVAWSFLVRYIFLHYMKHHKTHYKLSESVRIVGGGSGTSVNGNIQGGGGGGGGRERLKVVVQPPGVNGGAISSLPWKQILKSPPVIVLFVAHFSLSLFLHSSMSWLPFYWTLTFPSNNVWLCNVMPWVAMAITSIGASWISQWLKSRNTSLSIVRHTFTSLSLGGSSFFLLFTAVFSLNREHISFLFLVGCIIMVCLFHGLSTGGTLLNSLDLVPSYSGALFSVMDTLGAISGILGVHLTGLVIHSTGYQVLLLILLSAFNLMALVLYLILGSGYKLQCDPS